MGCIGKFLKFFNQYRIVQYDDEYFTIKIDGKADETE